MHKNVVELANALRKQFGLEEGYKQALAKANQFHSPSMSHTLYVNAAIRLKYCISDLNFDVEGEAAYAEHCSIY